MKFRLDTLAKRLLVPSLALVLVATTLFGTFMANQLIGSMSAAAERDAAQTSAFVADVSGPYITNYDLTALGSMVKGLTQDTQVTYAEYFDADGKSLTSDVMSEPADVSQLTIVVKPIKDSTGAVVGSFKLGQSRELIGAQREQAVMTVAAGVLAVLAVLAVGLTWAVRKVVRQIGGEPEYLMEAMRRAAAGDLSQTVAVRTGDTGSVLTALRDMLATLRGTVSTVQRSADGVATASAEIASGNNDLSVRTEQQAGALEQTAASMVQLGATVRQNADNARQANQLALGASTVAVQGGDVVTQVVETMKGINQSSRQIADIIGVIDSIAFQTNILALNAAVEAARAGEQGRGFAVVAAEVRNLAQRSAQAAKEIKTLITASVERVDQGTLLVDRAGTTMTEIVGAIKRVTDIMGEISAASTEQSAGVAKVEQAVSEMDRATQQNAALVEQSAAAAESLKAQANDLVQAVAAFKLASGSPAGDGARATVPETQASSARSVASAPAGSGVSAASASSSVTAAARASSAAQAAAAPVERRGPNRARNVVRPDFKAGSGPAADRPRAPAAAAAAASSGAATSAVSHTDEWESF
jgi:methyl-accepting chemotaxis protein